jgi:hypothetical protein
MPGQHPQVEEQLFQMRDFGGAEAQQVGVVRRAVRDVEPDVEQQRTFLPEQSARHAAGVLASTPPKITVQWGERADGAPGAPLRVYRLAAG